MRTKMSLTLISLMIVAGFCFPLSASAEEKSLGILYEEGFKNWRDNSTDPGFNTEGSRQGNKLRLATTAVAYGKAMSQLDPITINITRKTELILLVDRIDSGSVATIRVMNAYEPHDSYQVARVQGSGGEIKTNVFKLTGWEGVTSLWFEVWLEGSNKSITFSRIYFEDPIVEVKRRKEAAIREFTSRAFAPAPENSIYYEDFRKGPSGWRTDETDGGFYSELNFEGGAPRLKLVKGKGYCKIMSPLAGIQAEITSTTMLEISLGDVGTSRVKVDVMTAHAPFDNHTVIPWQKKPGVFSANLADASKWNGEKNFWIQLWMETTTNPETEAGAVINYLRIYDDTRVTKK